MMTLSGYDAMYSRVKVVSPTLKLTLAIELSMSRLRSYSVAVPSPLLKANWSLPNDWYSP